MLTRKYRSPLAIFLILAALPIASNRNKKHVRCEVIEAEDLCQLGRFFSDDVEKATAVQDLHLMRPAEMLADKEEKHKARVLVHGLERSFLGSGTHREVRSEVSVELLDLGADGRGMSFADDCELVLLESLSNGVFADPFQLNRLQQQEAVKYAQVYGDVDLERPARTSFQSIVELHQRLVPDKTNGLEALYRSEVTMPLHARYPLVSTESYFLVNITPPHVLIYCRRGNNITGTSANLKQELCIYALLGETLTKTLQWSIPSGNPGHSAWVTRLTTFSALAGVVAIFFASKTSTVK